MSHTKASPSGGSSRRDFLQKTALTAIAAGVATACGKSGGVAQAATADSHALPTGGTMGPHDTTTAADAMDAMHEKGIKAFPAKTAGKGAQLLEPRIENGVKVYDITAKVVKWEVEPGRLVEAWTYNGVVPAPTIRVKEGDRIRMNVKNELPESTAVHFHGLELPNNMDGVPFITQPPIKPGATYTYEFTVPNSGSHMYHS